MFRLKDILYLCEHGLNNVDFIPIDSSKRRVEIRNGVAGFVTHQCPEVFDPVKDSPEIVEEWTKEYDPQTVDKDGNITHFEETSYLYILQPFYKEVVDFYFKG